MSAFASAKAHIDAAEVAHEIAMQVQDNNIDALRSMRSLGHAKRSSLSIEALRQMQDDFRGHVLATEAEFVLRSIIISAQTILAEQERRITAERRPVQAAE